jgi:hypothetical protein
VEELPVTLNGYRPGTIAAVVATVSCELPEPVIDEGLNEQLAVLGSPAQASVTLLLNPFTGVIVTVEAALPPAGIVAGVREGAEISKS